ncbi:hypothetical protein NJ75_04554 [Novosphingobium subterraneum]|uniref:Uncharacterized protein n=1 Tax=Novosphingobium subterraneum TaxID=48936 RepID=A0A0B8Z624_9SPHN|nr:hypothetical protein NJ75_04554 [Novosphingobium subterraneum]
MHGVFALESEIALARTRFTPFQKCLETRLSSAH